MYIRTFIYEQSVKPEFASYMDKCANCVHDYSMYGHLCGGVMMKNIRAYS